MAERRGGCPGWSVFAITHIDAYWREVSRGAASDRHFFALVLGRKDPAREIAIAAVADDEHDDGALELRVEGERRVAGTT